MSYAQVVIPTISFFVAAHLQLILPFVRRYKLPDISSQVVRKVCETWTLAKYTDPEKSLFAKYLAHTNATAERHYREKVLDDICHGYKLVRRSGGCEESQTPDAAAPQMELNVVEREMECLSEPQDSSSSDGQ